VTVQTRSPYPGLRSFRREESDLFFGREACIDQMVDKLVATRFLAVLGSSGSGKSSLVRTGLLEALDLGLALQVGVRWAVADMRPGGRPLTNLAEALLKLASPGEAPSPPRLDIDLLASFLRRGPRSIVEWCRDGHLPARYNLLLLVDQFEELFRYGDYAGREEAEAFVALLLESAKAADLPIYVVMTMRSEFLGACALFPGLAEQINSGLYLTPRMTRQEIREAIEGPASVCGFAVEPALVNRLLNDLAAFAPWEDEHGAEQTLVLSRRADQLPLMQHVLNRMWTQAAATAQGAPVRITLVEYERLGGLSGALDAHAQEVLESLPAKDKPVVSHIFRALISDGSISAAVRRPCRFSELVAVMHGRRDSVLAVVNAFRARGCNFLTPSEGEPLEDSTVVDISHESLIRQWSELRDWLREEAKSAETYRHIEHNAELYSEKRSGLLSLPFLDEAQKWRRSENPTAAWAARYGGDFPLAMRYLDESIRHRAHKQYRIGGVAGLLVILLVTVSVGYSYIQKSAARVAEAKARAAEARLMSVQAHLKGELSFGYETKSFGVAPKRSLERNYGTDTPTAIPDGKVVHTKDLAEILNGRPPPILIDTLADDHETTILGAFRIPFAGQAGDFDDEVQQKFTTRLDDLTNGDHSRTLLFFCQGVRCWESYNASLRALRAGYTTVYWYRGGLFAWQDAGGHVQNAPQETRSLAERLDAAPAMPPRDRWGLAISLSESAQRIYGSYPETAIDYEWQAYHVLKELTSTPVDSLQLRSDLASTGVQLWGQLLSAKRTDQAKALYEVLKAAPDLLVSANVSNAVGRGVLAATVEQAADVFKTHGDTDTALAWYLAAQRAWANPAGDQPKGVVAEQHVAQIALHLATMRNDQGKKQDALQLLLEAETIDRQRVAEADDSGMDDLVLDLYRIGDKFKDLQDPDKALDKFREARSLLSEQLKVAPGDLRPMLLSSWIDYQMGQVLRDQVKLQDAFGMLEESVRMGKALIESFPGNDNVRTNAWTSSGALGSLAYQLVLSGDFARGLQAADDALSVVPNQVWIQVSRAHALLFLGHPDEAREIYTRFRGQTMDNGRPWDDALRTDFAELRQHGLANPLMEQVEGQLGASK
jgi:rhodanese-related sulfurtransferase